MLNKVSLSLIAIAALSLASCAPMDSDGISLEQRVNDQDRRLRQMQPQQADAMNELRAMRQEINQLKGQLRNMNNPDGARMDNTRPFETGEATLDGQTPIVASQTPTPDAVPTGNEPVPMNGLGTGTNYSPESSAYGASRTLAMPGANPPPTTATRLEPVAGQPGTYAILPQSGAYAATQPQNPAGQTGSYGLPVSTPQDATHVQAPSEATWGQADPKPVEQPVAQKDISLALFDAGVNSYNAHDYDAARRSFQDFLKNYPGHAQTAQAQYYLAECDFQSNDFPQAALAFDTVIKKYPKSSSAPGAYLKQALCFSKMNQAAAAKARMREIIAKFPNSPEAARAKSFLKTNK